jgi:hypothetical protein
MRRFAAKLLFQFRPSRRSDRSAMALCEERIVTFGAQSPRAARLPKPSGLGGVRLTPTLWLAAVVSTSSWSGSWN